MVIELIIAVLAAWRITSAINREHIGEIIRVKLAGEKEDVVGLKSYKDNLIANMIMCFMCLSFWVSVFCVVMLFVYPPFLYPFAISTLVIFLDKVY